MFKSWRLAFISIDLRMQLVIRRIPEHNAALGSVPALMTDRFGVKRKATSLSPKAGL